MGQFYFGDPAAKRVRISSALTIEEGEIDLVINVPRTYDTQGRPDGFRIRRAAIDHGIPLVTDPQLARTVIEALRRTGGFARLPLPMDHYPVNRNRHR